VCSFETLADDDYLDVDWAPSLLLAAADATPIGAADREQLRRAFEGDAEVNLAYREVPDSIWEHPVCAVDEEAVRLVAETLRRLVGSGFPSMEVATAAVASYAATFRPSDPHSYLRRHLEAVAAFYTEAARREACVMVWWD